MIADSYFRTRKEAENEVRRRKRDPAMSGTITTISSSPYGGYRVHSVSAELAADFLVDYGGVSVPGFDVLTGKTRR